MLSGVPQESCLGPLLFLAYTNDIDDSIKISILKHADDIKIYRRIWYTNASTDINSLQEDLVSLSNWSKTWLLNFNLSKCAMLHFGKNNPHHQYLLDNEPISCKQWEKDLGIYICDDLNFSLQVSNMVKKAEKVMCVLKKYIVSRDKEVFLTLSKQLVRPHLEYATCVWNTHFKAALLDLNKYKSEPQNQFMA